MGDAPVGNDDLLCAACQGFLRAQHLLFHAPLGIIQCGFQLGGGQVGYQAAFVGEVPQQAGRGGEQQQGFGFQRGGNHRGSAVGVYVEGFALFAHGQGGNHRCVARAEQGFQQGGVHGVNFAGVVAAQDFALAVFHNADAALAFGLQQAAIEAAQPKGINTVLLQLFHQKGVDFAVDGCGKDFQGGAVGVAAGEARRRGDEARRGAEGFAEGVGFGRAAVHNHHLLALGNQRGDVFAGGGEIDAFGAAEFDDKGHGCLQESWGWGRLGGDARRWGFTPRCLFRRAGCRSISSSARRRH